MRPRGQFAVALVTAPDMGTARRLARAALAARLIACANLVPKMESHFWWQGRVTRGIEVLMLLKTTSSRLAALEKLILTQHPYDTPEFIAWHIHHGNKRFLEWWGETVT
jgi:periplasmic divalent cation tolerance protein